MKTHRVGGLVLGAGLFLAACGSGGAGQSAGGGYGAAPPTSAPPSSAAAPVVTVKAAESKLGKILVDSQGRTLYALTKDANGIPTCDGACADAWPPLMANGATKPSAGVDAALLSTVPRSDGTSQLKVGKWPVYLYAGDGAPGDVNGQGSGGVWFVVSPDGSLNKG